MTTPTVAVVVPTYNRSDRLPALVAALAAQVGVGDFEVIVVDDASSDETADVLESLKHGQPFSLVALRQPSNRGPAAARNRGWQAATAPLICFTDDDCVPTERWLAEMVDALAVAEVVQGRTLPNPAQEGNRGPFSHTLEIDWEMGYYETANMGYRRPVLEALSGFDETFRFAYGEDCELAWRARETGARTSFCHAALVYHDITPSNWKAALKNTRRREGMVQVFHRRPGLQSKLGKGLFYEPTHVPAIAVAVTAVALVMSPRSSARWAGSAATGLWYAWNCRRTRGKPKIGNIGWLAVVPAALAVDLADVAVFARASFRYRILQL